MASVIFYELRLPLWLEHAIRLIELGLCIACLLMVSEGIRGRPGNARPTWLKLLLLGILIFLVRAGIAQGERWDAPLWAGGAPVTIVIEVLIASAWIVRWHEHFR